MTLPVAIGRYEIVARLATGGMAEILLARIRGPESFERPVVIKRVLGHLSTPDTEKMFLEEARIAASIRHPNVVQVYELGSEDGELYLAMEYLEGETAASLMRRLTRRGDRLSASLAAFVAAEVCAGLHAAHDLRGPDKQPLALVHRDVSPHNVFITYDGDVKLLDFGIAKTVLSPARTEAGMLKGKLAYMSPEQCVGTELDRRSDLFSLGIVLHELLMGKQLFQRATPLLTMQAIVKERALPLSSLDADVPPRLSEVCARALEPDRDARHATAAEMRRELVAVQRSLSPDADLREELGRLMHALYADRIDAKERMLQEMRGGGAPDHVPEGEADVDVEIPVAEQATISGQEPVGQMTHAGTSMDRRSAPGSRRRARFALLIAAVLPLAAGVAFLLPAGQPRDPRSSDEAPSTGASGSGAAAEASGEPDAIAPSEVRSEVATIGVHLDSVPPGAAVRVGGEPRGTTPTLLRFPRSREPVDVELVLGGYAPLRQEVLPDVDQRLVLSLVAQRSPTRRSPDRPRAEPPSATPPSSPPSAPPSSAPPAPPSPSTVPASSASPPGFTRFN